MKENRAQKIPILNAVLLGSLNIVCMILLFVAQEVWHTVQNIELGLYEHTTSIALNAQMIQSEKTRLTDHISDSKRHNLP